MEPRTITLILNDRCPLRCAHCSLGYSEDNIGSGQIMSGDKIEQLIIALDPSVYTMVVLAGGEPALVPKLVSRAVDACSKVGIYSALTTAPFWAQTAQTACNFLDRISRPTFIILSFDKYHLEFITLAHYENALAAALEREICVALNICFSTAADKKECASLIQGFETRLTGITWSQVMPQGNAGKTPGFVSEVVVLNSLEDLGRIPRSCKAGNALVNLKNELHACCWSGEVTDSPLMFGFDASAGEPLGAMEKNQTFQQLRTRGLLDSLSAGRSLEVLNDLRGKAFVNECHLCVTLMKKRNHEFSFFCV
jgi:hypothetical protein